MNSVNVKAWWRLISITCPTWRQKFRLFLHMMKRARAGFVTPSIRRQRLAVCEQCPIYCPELQSCGTIESKLGCKCYVPILTWFKGSCWAITDFPESELGWD